MRLYSPEWVAAFNEAVGDLEPAPEVSFRMLQLVEGAPEGTLRVTLSGGAEEGGITLRATPGTPGAEPEPQVTVVVAYDDAVGLAEGQLEPATLLAEGRVKVRGDLSVLVRAQAILAEAASRVARLSEQ